LIAGSHVKIKTPTGANNLVAVGRQPPLAVNGAFVNELEDWLLAVVTSVTILSLHVHKAAVPIEVYKPVTSVWIAVLP